MPRPLQVTDAVAEAAFDADAEVIEARTGLPQDRWADLNPAQRRKQSVCVEAHDDLVDIIGGVRWEGLLLHYRQYLRARVEQHTQGPPPTGRKHDAHIVAAIARGQGQGGGQGLQGNGRG